MGIELRSLLDTVFHVYAGDNVVKQKFDFVGEFNALVLILIVFDTLG